MMGHSIRFIYHSWLENAKSNLNDRLSGTSKFGLYKLVDDPREMYNLVGFEKYKLHLNRIKATING